MRTSTIDTVSGERIVVLDEPTLQFAEGQDAIDPHDGLALFGPFSRDTPSHPQSPAYIVLGTPEGIDLFRKVRSPYPIRKPGV
jgi:hypothetical protein